MERKEIEKLTVMKLLKYFYNHSSSIEMGYIMANYVLPVSKDHLRHKFEHYINMERCDYIALMADQLYLIKIFIDRANVIYDDGLNTISRLTPEESVKYNKIYNDAKLF